jgi:hypothetical protein
VVSPAAIRTACFGVAPASRIAASRRSRAGEPNRMLWPASVRIGSAISSNVTITPVRRPGLSTRSLL